MATALAVGDVVQFQVWCTDAEQASVNSMHYEVIATGPTPATDLDAATEFDSLIETNYKQLIVNSATYNGVLARIKNRLPLPAPVTVNANAGAGTAGATGLPRQAAGLLSFHTSLAGARGRGRIYLPFPSTADNQGGGGVTAGYVTKLDALWSAIEGTVLVNSGGRTASLLFVVYHQKGTGSPATFPITSHVSSHGWATQKKRGSFGRANASPF